MVMPTDVELPHLCPRTSCPSDIIVVTIVYDLGQRQWLVKELHLIYFPFQNIADMRTFVTDRCVPYKFSLRKTTLAYSCN